MGNKEDKEIKVTSNRKVILKPFDKDRSFFGKEHDGRIRYSGCKSAYTLPWEFNSRRYVKIFEDGEQDAFEKALDLESGSLNLYKRKKSWWSEFFVHLDKNERTFDLNSPMESLEYRVLKANRDDIAESKSMYNGTQSYYIIDEGEVEQDNYKLAQKREEAMEAFMKLRKSNKKMYDILRVLGKKPNKEMSSNSTQLKAELDKVISQVEKLDGVPNIDDFLAVNKDALFQDKIFVLDAIDIGEIELKNGTYRMKETSQPLGRSLNEVAEYFYASKNQDDKLLVQQRIDLNK